MMVEPIRASAVAGVLLVVAAGTPFTAADARDQVQIVGSSTVYPYAHEVVGQFVEATEYARPALRSTGTGGGFELFCQGVGFEHPDISLASRPMTRAEWDLCRINRVDDITEVPIGFDGLTIAHSRASHSEWSLTRRQIFDALAARLPRNGVLVHNPNETWADVDATLAELPIRVMGPPPTSGTRDSFVELGMRPGCRTYPELAAMEKTDPLEWEAVCSTIRSDGAYIESSEDDSEIVEAIMKDPDLLGIFGYSHLYSHEDRISGVRINNFVPNFFTIAGGEYVMARPLYFYVKNQHRELVPGLNEFVAEFASQFALALDGYLVELGLTPVLDEAELEENIGRALVAEKMYPPEGRF